MKKGMTRLITTGAAAVAIFVVLYAILAYDESSLQEMLSIISVVPLALYTQHYGRKAGIISAAAAICLSVFLVQPTILITYAIPSAISGAVFGMILGKHKLTGTICILALVYVVRFIYELGISSYFFKVDFVEEYSQIVDSVSNAVAGNAINSSLYKLAHDMTLFSIPVILILGAAAKAGIVYIISGIISTRLFKKAIDLTIPQINGNDKLLGILYYCLFVAETALLILTLCNVFDYSVIIAVLLDIGIVLMYLFLVYCFRKINDTFNLRRRVNFLLTLLMIALFPITGLVFATAFVFTSNHDDKQGQF